ncbi:MAG: hypothetical protein HY706_22280 [Candidatus Hydrogenedentes bacterium]|nr:hypothetical protein [Candidatus Hydrogenedentota bacterium]
MNRKRRGLSKEFAVRYTVFGKKFKDTPNFPDVTVQHLLTVYGNRVNTLFAPDNLGKFIVGGLGALFDADSVTLQNSLKFLEA